MALRSTSLLLLAAWLTPGSVQGQAFGRFGYVEKLDLPGFTVDARGFAAKQDAADLVRFARPAKVWKPTATSEFEQTVALGGPAGNPAKVRASLFAPGFSLYFEKGFSFHVSSTGAPYLTWREGSASTGLPTPNVRWVVVSFRDSQPPLTLGFPDGPQSLKVTGVPGSWTLEGAADFKGWIRVGLPTGLTPSAANSAGALGRLAESAAENEEIWSTLPPQLQALDLKADEDSVTATWQFDRPGALLPEAAVLANLGGYPLKVLSPTRRLPMTWGEGPVEASTSQRIQVRLPARRVPTGRGLCIGAELGSPIGTASPFDLPSVVELGLETLSASRDAQTKRAAEDTYGEYIAQGSYSREPWTAQSLPYDAAGVGIDLAAAHAFLSQASTSSTQATSEANSLLTSVSWRQDWNTWLPWVEDATIRRRSAALCALAGAFCPEAERRLSAAMFQAGLSAERGLEIWRRRTGLIKSERPMLEPVFGLRQGLYRLAGPSDPDAPYVETLLSPIRLFSDVPVRVVQSGAALTLEWSVLEPKPSIMNLVSANPFGLEAVSNLPKFKLEQVLGNTQLRYTPETEGTCQARLILPDYARPLPPAHAVPRYSEPAR